MTNKNLYYFWGKAAKPNNHNFNNVISHPALCHILDVGLVAQALLEQPTATNNDLLLRHLHCPEEQKIKWIAFIVALHDIGKFSPGFQAKRKELVEHLLAPEDFPFDDRDETDHGRVTFETLPDLLEEACGCPPSISVELARTVGAHHGKFHQALSFGDGKNVGDKSWQTVRQETLEALLKVFDLHWEHFPFQAQSPPSVAFFLALAGLTSVADWLGSDEDYFEYMGAVPYSEDKQFNLNEYVKKRLETARQLINELRLKGSTISGSASQFHELFPLAGKPNECQRLTVEIAQKLELPALIIIETQMGSGKTEAALAATDIWLRDRNANGLYYALPTQATANQMFGRIKAFIEKNRAIDSTQLHLLHNNAEFQDDYEQLKQPKMAAIYDDNDNHPEDSPIKASTWFTAKKRGLISPFAVGTIDQALLAVLQQAKHAFVRLYGLVGKVVVIDEIHAYDTYTSTLIDYLLKWLAALNTSVILLSATLPEKRRQQLLQTYAPNMILNTIPEYPCIIGVNRQGQPEIVDNIQLEGTLNSFTFELIKTTTVEQRWQMVEHILKEKLLEGGCAVCILNTVMEAQALFTHISNVQALSSGTQLILFHARFPIGKRLEIEKALETYFGKDATHRPNRAIVVATQVVEQSLDVDFDLMITALAPIDLLLQRAGRLHRHNCHNEQRPSALKQATLICLQTDLTANQPDFGLTGKIYRPDILLKTALVLENLNQYLENDKEIKLPHSVQTLIAHVYGPKTVNCPVHLQETLQMWEDSEHVIAGSVVRIVIGDVLPIPASEDEEMEFFDYLTAGYQEDELLSPKTRLAPPSLTIIILHKIAGQLYLVDKQQKELVHLNQQPTRAKARALLLHSVNISHPDWYHYFIQQDTPKGWKKSPLLRHCRAAKFENGQIIVENQTLRISDQLGLEMPLPKGARQHVGDV